MITKLRMPSRGLLQIGLAVGVFASMTLSLFAAPQNVSAASARDARAFANSYCPDPSFPEQRLADYMWLTNRAGGNDVSIVDGQAEVVPVHVNFFVTYCKFWGNYADGATGLQANEGGKQRLLNQPGQINYGGTAIWGQRAEWGTATYNADLDVSGWQTGAHRVCTAFTTTSNKPGAMFFSSPSACFTIDFTRIKSWDVTGQSYITNVTDRTGRRQTVTASPGDRLDWAHTLTNDGPGNMDRNVTYNVRRSGFPGNLNAFTTPSGSKKGVNNQLFVNIPSSTGQRTRYVVQPTDGGRVLCQRITWKNKSSTDSGVGSSAAACARVAFNYDLTPSVAGPRGMRAVGSRIPTVTPKVRNEVPGNLAATTATPNTIEWQLKRIEVAPNGTIPTAQADNDLAPCAYYRNTCTDKGSGTRAFAKGTTALAPLNNETVDADMPAGTQICFALSVRPHSDAVGSSWRHSAPVCTMVSKQPKIQVWGNDVRTRGGIETGTAAINDGGADKLFGSWVEYGAFSIEANTGFASGSGLNGGSDSTDAADLANAWNKLTFANKDNGDTSHGFYRSLPADLPAITSQFIGAPSAGPMSSDLGTLASGTYRVTNATISTSTVGLSGSVGKSIIIVASGTVTINGDIRYQGPGGNDTFTKITEIPQVVIIARNINITNAAKQVDAWLLTTAQGGGINTCSDRAVTDRLNSTVCNNVLTVNGPVATEHLYLRRTAGSDTVDEAGSPAEIFNLRPDAYLWAYARASQAGKVQTVYSDELPPRF